MNFGKLLSWIPGWLGFLLLILAGTAMFIHGAVNPLGVTLDQKNRTGFIIFGLCSLVIGAVSWLVGGTSKIKGREGTVGVKVEVKDLPWWGWLVDVGVLAISILLYVLIS